MCDGEVCVIKPQTASERMDVGVGGGVEECPACAASSPGSFSPPICIGADLLTEALTGVASYCTGKQKN